MRGLARLRPAFGPGGTHTAGNSCGINDGAAVVALADAATHRRLGLPGLRVLATATAGLDPNRLGLSLVPAARLALDRAGLTLDEIDVVELNEANDGAALPVFARGTTCLTTKRHASGRAQFDVPVSVGGVTVRPGDIVLGDDNGVVVLAPEVAADVILQAVESDAAEPKILNRIAAGEPLEGILYLGQ